MRKSFLLSVFILLALLAACGPKATPSPTPSPIPPTDTPTPTPASPLAILLLPATTPDSVSQAYQSTVYGLAQSSGYRFQVRNAMTPAEVASEPGLKILVALAPDPGLAEMAAAAPGVQFLGVNIPGLTAGANLSLIGGSGDTSGQAPFLAGYIGAMLAQDYRTGMIVEKDASDTPAIEAAVSNGQGFYCGICNPVTAPYYGYPLAVEMPAGTTGNEAIAYGDYLVDHQAEVIYIAPTVADDALINNLVSRGMLLIGETPPPDNARAGWIATIQPDWMGAISQAWPKLVAGEGGFSAPSPISLTNINTDLLTAGKQRLAEDVLSRLGKGEIATQVQP